MAHCSNLPPALPPHGATHTPKQLNEFINFHQRYNSNRQKMTRWEALCSPRKVRPSALLLSSHGAALPLACRGKRTARSLVRIQGRQQPTSCNGQQGQGESLVWCVVRAKVHTLAAVGRGAQGKHLLSAPHSLPASPWGTTGTETSPHAPASCAAAPPLFPRSPSHCFSVWKLATH